MRILWQVWWAGCFAALVLAQTAVDVGVGASGSPFRQQFLDAWSRNGFRLLAGDPLGYVTNYGSTGLIQQFPLASGKAGTLALIKPDMTATSNVFQVSAQMFAYYGSVSVSNAGYPTTDTANCPALRSAANASNSCQWQPFSNSYELFVYVQPVATGGQNFTVRIPFYTKWTTLGGLSGLGPANSAETQVTSQFSSKATVQTYDQGAIYNITSGVLTGRLLAIKEPVYDLYVASGADAGSLGLPMTEDLLLASGLRQQTFEGGAIEYDPSTGVAVLQPRIASLALVPNGSIHMNLGDKLTAQVTVYSSAGVLTDRTVTWNTSNGKVVQVQPSGLTATLIATGAGTATVTASAEGKTSSSLIVTVTTPCCQVGEGAPNAAIQQAFQAAVARDKLTIQLPAASIVTRVGNGYVQQLSSAGTAPISYLIAEADGSAAAYVVTGGLLVSYLALGGPTGSLGYPLADATAGGRQTFQSGTLAGIPVQLISGAILTKWATLGYETGVAGSPNSAATQFLTFTGTTGSAQPFQNALILNSGSGPAFEVTGLVLSQYISQGGPTGLLGAPTDDEHLAGALRQQDFEGGSINYAPGASTANVVVNPRQPTVTTTPSTVVSGTPVHLIAGGFNNGATIRVSQTGQPDFLVTAATGAYAWDVQIPSTAASGVIAIRAVDVNSAAVAQGSYIVRNVSSAPLTLSIVSGDGQNGPPGALLPQPLVVVLQDENGNAAQGQPVTFTASPGGQVTPVSTTTGANGQASAIMRIPASAGIALATAQAGHQVVTFSARSQAFSLSNVPPADGTLVSAAASILGYYQLVNVLPQPNGLADAATLSQFLKSLCVFDAQGKQICDGFVPLGPSSDQIVNLWRLGAFVGNNLTVSIETANVNAVRDLVATGSPVLLVFGSSYAVATGIAADGSLVTSPAVSTGTLIGAVRLLPQPPGSSGFLVAATAPVAISSVTGACGRPLQLGSLYFEQCDGAANSYQLDIAAPGAFTGMFTGLATPAEGIALTGSAATSLEISGAGPQWTVSPLALSLTASGVENAASFTSAVAPGGLISIFGNGLFRAGAPTTVQLNGESAQVLTALPFLVNAQIPLDISPGTAVLSVTSGNGTAQESITVNSVAPAIFTVAPGQGAITNQDNSLNSPSNPANRGSFLVIYGTGFGAVTSSGGLSRANTPVSTVIGGIEIPAAFAGLTPGTVGLYQANVQIPSTLPPGLNLALYLKQASTVSNTVSVAIQ